MAIAAGSDILASDFIDTSAGAGDAGKGVKVDSAGKIDESFQKAPITKKMVAGETINGATLPVPIYQNTTDNEVYACIANDQAKLEFIGFAVSDSTDGAAIDVVLNGIVGGFSALDEGVKYYVQDTSGTIGTAMGTYEILVGIAISSTELLIQKGNWEYIGSASVAMGTAPQTLTSPTAARFAILVLAADNGTTIYDRETMPIAKKGASTVKRLTDTTNPAGFQASWSGDTITLSLFGTLLTRVEGTAYFYK